MLKSLIFAGFALNLYAAGTANPLLGKWRTGADCNGPSFVFSEKMVTQNTEEDGEPATNNFKKIGYVIKGGIVTVDFGAAHKIPDVGNDSKVDFKVIKADRIQMIRTSKGQPSDLYKCP